MKKKLVFITGRSSSGKNTIAKLLLEDNRFEELPMHTSRPRRTPNEDGYVFHDDDNFLRMIENDEFVETRCYNTNLGLWYYGTTKQDIYEVFESGKIPVITSGTPEMYEKIVKALKDYDIEIVVCYLKVNDYELLSRAMNREKIRKNPDYTEMCRRFLADSKDYSDENIAKFPLNSIYQETSAKKNLELFLKNNNLY